MKIHVCVPVLNRYDLLRAMLESLLPSSVVPAQVIVVDNGRSREKVTAAVEGFPWHVRVEVPERPMGVAESWNWFLRNVPEERLITNDDILFTPRALELAVLEEAPFVSYGHGFSCFLIRDECVRRVGEFDESISPGYAYFEDRDYLRRMRREKVQDAVVKCGVKHFRSQTLKALDQKQLEDHHKKFVIAQENFLKKWGDLDEDTPRQFLKGVNS